MTRRAKVVLAVWAALTVTMLLAPPQARAIPAFARKYGLRCTACHEAWPKLNDFGRAFRDNGYQMLLGKDDAVTASPGYWPVSIRLTPHYEFNEVTNQPTDQGVKRLRTGGVAGIGMDLLTAGTLFNNVSFLVVPTGFAPDGVVTLESAWVRFDNLFGKSWANLKIGKHEVDLPVSAHRPWNLSSTGYLIYGFHASGSASSYDMGTNQRGIEYMGHDRGSLNRVSVSFFDVEDSPGSRHVFDTPGFYAHATHEWFFDNSPISEAKVGVFGSYTSWPTTFFTSDGEPIPGTGGNLEPSSKYGVEGQIWLGKPATPFHAILVFAHGQDSKALIPDATRNGTCTRSISRTVPSTPCTSSTRAFARGAPAPTASTLGRTRFSSASTSLIEGGLHEESVMDPSRCPPPRSGSGRRRAGDVRPGGSGQGRLRAILPLLPR